MVQGVRSRVLGTGSWCAPKAASAGSVLTLAPEVRVRVRVGLGLGLGVGVGVGVGNRDRVRG